MAREVINVGASPNDGQGDPIRTSFEKTNNNFGELYARAQENPPATLVGSVGDFAGMYAYDSHYFYYCFQDYDGSTVIWAEIPNTVIDAIEIVNGTSNVSIPTANGNVRVSVANVADVAVFSSGGANFTAITASSAVINGDLTVTGNATLSGNIVGDRITNGTTSIEIPAADGNATVTVGNITNVAVFTTSGLVADMLSATGNVVGLNLVTAGVVTATGNITGGNILTSADVQAAVVSASANLVGGNLVIPNGARIRGDFTSLGSQGRTVFQTTNTSVNGSTFISSVPGDNNANILGAGVGAWSSADLGNAAIIGVYSYANQGALRSLAVGTANANPITFLFNDTEVARFSTGGNLGIANTAPVDPLAVSGTAYVSGNITTGDGITAAGNITANFFFGNGSALTGVTATGNVGAATKVVSGTTEIDIPVANGNIVGNVGGVTNLFQWSTDGFSAQGNITGAYIIGDGSLLTGLPSTYTDADVTSLLAAFGSNAYLSTGNVTSGNLRTTGIVSATGNVIGGNVSTTGNVSGNYILGNGALLTGVASSYGNAEVVANLADLSSNPISTTGNVTAGYFIGDGSLLTNITVTTTYSDSNVTSLLANFGSNVISTAGNVTVANSARVTAQVYGLVNGVNTAYGTWDFGYIAANTYTNPIQWIFAQTSAGNMDLGTITAPASLTVDVGTIF